MSSAEEIEDFCIEHVNGLSLEAREEIFDLIRMSVKDEDIDSSNSDGSRVYTQYISEEVFLNIYRLIKLYLET